jgi:hypothetical protein
MNCSLEVVGGPSGDRRLAIADASADAAIRETRFPRKRTNRCSRSAARASPRTNVFVKQYDIYATAPNRSEARIFRVI